MPVSQSIFRDVFAALTLVAERTSASRSARASPTRCRDTRVIADAIGSIAAHA